MKASTIAALVVCVTAVIAVVIWSSRVDRVIASARAGDPLARWRVGRGARVGLVLADLFGLGTLLVVNAWYTDWRVLGMSPLILAGLAMGVIGATAYALTMRARSADPPPKPYQSGIGWLVGWLLSEAVVLTLGHSGLAVALGLAVGVTVGLTPALWRLRPGWGAEARADVANQGIERTP